MRLLLVSIAVAVGGCSTTASAPPNGVGSTGGTGGSGTDAAFDGKSPTGGAGGSSGTSADASDGDTPPLEDTIDANQNRLLESYLAYLKQAHPDTPQSNGLSGNLLPSVCELWAQLQPSAQAVFLSLSARLQGSTLGSDGRSMLYHLTKLYRLVGGDGATATDPGSCGGSEFNRIISSMDDVLHTALVAANDHQGAVQPNGKYDITDIQTDDNPFWRDSHDLSGSHGPFDLSDETDRGAPRAQVHYFRDPASTLASSPLGRTDVENLIDPYSLEVDQDYDCTHNSNPLCSYVFYAVLCVPQPSKKGIDIYNENFGAVDLSWKPKGC